MSRHSDLTELTINYLILKTHLLFHLLTDSLINYKANLFCLGKGSIGWNSRFYLACIPLLNMDSFSLLSYQFFFKICIITSGYAAKVTSDSFKASRDEFWVWTCTKAKPGDMVDLIEDIQYLVGLMMEWCLRFGFLYYSAVFMYSTTQEDSLSR